MLDAREANRLERLESARNVFVAATSEREADGERSAVLDALTTSLERRGRKRVHGVADEHDLLENEGEISRSFASLLSFQRWEDLDRASATLVERAKAAYLASRGKPLGSALLLRLAPVEASC